MGSLVLQENLMWMAAFWDPVAGDYSANQDWFPVEDNGSVWEADLMGKGRLCFDGLTAMRAWMLQPKSSVPSPVLSPTDGLKNFMLAFTSAWCKRVRDGIMAPAAECAHCWHPQVSHRQPWVSYRRPLLSQGRPWLSQGRR